MQKYLIPENGQFYKANLHCHTTVSDGDRTPQEIKDIYMAKGYSIVAFTDHDVLVPHPELRSEDFLPLNGFEAEVDAPDDAPWSSKKTCHICFVAKDPDNVTMPFYHPDWYIWGNGAKYRPQLKFDPKYGNYVRKYSHEGVSEMMKIGRDAGFFVTYNHPTWSLQDYSDYMGYEGMHAMEIMNYGCWHGGFMDYNVRVFDDMLRGGKRVFCTATDDNHHPEHEGGGWTMIKADKLDYKTITDALEKGNFYASWGPEIHSLWVEDGKIHITCSPASRIIVTYKARRSWALNGENLTEATFTLRPDDGYVRITVVDEKGRCADTNAYFIDDLLEEG